VSGGALSNSRAASLCRFMRGMPIAFIEPTSHFWRGT